MGYRGRKTLVVALCAAFVWTVSACGGDDAETSSGDTASEGEGEGEDLRSRGGLPGGDGGDGGDGGESGLGGPLASVPITGTDHNAIIISGSRSTCPTEAEPADEEFTKPILDTYTLDLGEQPAATQEAVSAGIEHVVTFGFLPDEAYDGYRSYSTVRACLKLDDANQNCFEGPYTAGERHQLAFKPNATFTTTSVIQVRMTGDHWMACPDGEPQQSTGSVNLTFGAVTLEYTATP